MKDNPASDNNDPFSAVSGGRSNGPAQERTEAEAAEESALADARDEATETARIIGLGASIFGFLFMAGALIVLVGNAPGIVAEIDSRPQDATWTLRAFACVPLSVLLLQGLCGLALGVGGIGFRRLKEWGRRTILGVIWLLIPYCISIPTMVIVEDLIEKTPERARLIGAVISVLVAAVWVVLLGFAIRYFSSQEVRDLCTPDYVAEESDCGPTDG